MTADVLSAQTVRRGQFTEAYKLLQDAKNDVDRTSLAEVLKLLGHPEEALGCANQLLSKWKIHETELAARVLLCSLTVNGRPAILRRGSSFRTGLIELLFRLDITVQSQRPRSIFRTDICDYWVDVLCLCGCCKARRD